MKAPRSSPTAAVNVSIVRAAALRKRCLSFAKTCSIGFRSGEYFGSLADSFAFVAAEIVHNDEIARPQGGRRNLLDILLERCGVDRTIEEPRRLDAIAAKRGDEGRGFPMAVRNLGDKARAKRRPSPERLHVGFGRGLVDEDQALGIDLVLPFSPLFSPARDVGPVAFARHHGFF